jgi:hypothetical protein
MTDGPATIDPTIRALIVEAESAYTRGDWGGALTAYGVLQARHPDLAPSLLLPIAMSHCEIELNGSAAPRVFTPPPQRGEIDRVRSTVLRVRALALSREGDAMRASNLLRLLASFNPQFSDIYAHDIFGTGPSKLALEPLDDTLPPCVATVPDDAAIGRLKSLTEGVRVLLIVRRFFQNLPTRQYQYADDMLRSATRFGLSAREINSYIPPPGVEQADYPDALQAAITDWRPQLIVFDDLFERGLSAIPALGERIGTVLETARRVGGARVVKLLPDGWIPAPDSIYRGLGTHFDLVNHLHPARLPDATARERAATFCYPFPFDNPVPTVPPGTIPRVCFVGSINAECPARVAWWAECARIGIPLDVFLTDHAAADQRSDQDYVNLLCGYQVSVNFTRRHTGVRIATGRSIETPLAGGLLVEEDSVDTRYFMKPGAHYVAFDNLTELKEATTALLADPALRQRIARDGQAWVEKYFTGDHFWAGLLQRLEIGGA